MKFSFLDTGTLRALYDKTSNNILGISPGVDAAVAECPMPNVNEAARIVLNSSVGAVGWKTIPDIRKKLMEEYFQMSDGEAVSSLFAIFNGEVFSDWIEVVYSNRLLTGEVGPILPFTQGCAMLVKEDVKTAIPGLGKLRNFLQQINYKGEVLCHITSDYQLCDLAMGHFYGHFGLFAEQCPMNVQEILEFAAGARQECKVKDSLVLGTSIYPAGFPFVSEEQKIQAPTGAEKHLWRIFFAGVPVALATVYGMSLREARSRMFRTLTNLRGFDDVIQYRVDFGLHLKFLLCQEQYEKFQLVANKVSPPGSSPKDPHKPQETLPQSPPKVEDTLQQ